MQDVQRGSPDFQEGTLHVLAHLPVGFRAIFDIYCLHQLREKKELTRNRPESSCLALLLPPQLRLLRAHRCDCGALYGCGKAPFVFVPFVHHRWPACPRGSKSMWVWRSCHVTRWVLAPTGGEHEPWWWAAMVRWMCRSICAAIDTVAATAEPAAAEQRHANRQER